MCVCVCGGGGGGDTNRIRLRSICESFSYIQGHALKETWLLLRIQWNFHNIVFLF